MMILPYLKSTDTQGIVDFSHMFRHGARVSLMRRKKLLHITLNQRTAPKHGLDDYACHIEIFYLI
jgi:hypothetical protein